MLRLTSFFFAVLLFSYPGQSLIAAPAPPSTTAPVIEAVTHSAQTALRAGDRLTVTVRGTGGGTATFSIFGLAADVEMREIRSGGYPALTSLYTGVHVVRPGEAARNAAVFATLTVRGTEVMAASPRVVTIDARMPVITSRNPKPEARLQNLRPNIAIDLVDLETGVDPATVRIVVNGRNVTTSASISETAVVHNPQTAFKPGPVRVQLTVGDRAKNILQHEWTFQIAPPGDLINSITINPASPLTRDEILTVVMTGAPGGSAVISIEGIRGLVPMKESQTPGIYFGSMPVRPEHAVVDAVLRVTLEKNGRKSIVPAAALVTILPAPPEAPRISSRAISSADPNNGRLSLGGISGAGFRILGRLSYSTRSESLETEGPLGEFVIVAGADGRWQASIGPLIPLNRARLTLTLVAIDPAGQRSPPTTIELTS